MVGCKDMNTRVHAATYLSNLVIMALGSQSDIIVEAAFHKDSLDVSFWKRYNNIEHKFDMHMIYSRLIL